MDVQAKPHPQYKLLGAEVSLFTGKARAYMKWKGIPFKEVMSTDDVYKTLITPHTSLISIPCLLIHYPDPDGALGSFEVIQDTKDIIDYFEHTFPSPPPSTKHVASLADHAVLPPSPKRAFAALILEMLADEWLLLQAMYWRWGDGVWEKERFEEQLKFLEFEFGNTGTGGRPSVSYKETCNIGKKVSLPGIASDECLDHARLKMLNIHSGLRDSAAPYPTLVSAPPHLPLYVRSSTISLNSSRCISKSTRSSLAPQFPSLISLFTATSMRIWAGTQYRAH